MKLTPIDLQQKSFRKLRFGGLDEEGGARLPRSLRLRDGGPDPQLHKQDEELRRLVARIEELRSREQLLQQTLTTAQRLAEEVKEHARKEAEIVLSEAELQGEKIVPERPAEAPPADQGDRRSERTRMTFVQQLSSLLDTHRALLDSARGDRRAAAGASPADDNLSFLAPPTKRADTKK